MQIQPYTSKYNTYTQSNLLKSRNNYMSSTPLKQDQVSFGFRPMNALTDGLAKGMGSLGATRPVQRLVDFLKDRNYQQHLAAFVGVVLSSFYMIDTAKSKTIEKDQKMPLIVNQGAVCALSTIGAYTLDNYLDKHIANFKEKFDIANITDPKTRDMFARLYDNPEYLDVVKRRANDVKGERAVIEKLDKFVTDELFKSNVNTEEHLKKLLEQNDTDNIAKTLIEKIEKLQETNISKNGGNIGKIEKAKELFLNELNSSKTLREIYKDISKNYIEQVDLATITDKEAKRVFEKLKSNKNYLENVLRVKQLNESFIILDKMFEYNKGVETQLKKLVKSGNADDAVKNILEEISKLPKKLANAEGITIDKADKAKELFMAAKAKSKQLTEIFNKQSMTNAIKLVSNNDTKLSTLMNGFKIAKSLMIFAMIYRFISPVFATPLANSISERIEKKKQTAAAK